MPKEYPILEFDPAEAVIEPSREIQPIDIPERCVLCFFREALNKLHEEGTLKLLRNLKSEMGDHPIYTLEWDEMAFAVCHPGLGGPLAGALLEELIALGCERFIACGGAGVLDREIAVGHILVPTTAVRDEGLSYHYLPPSREVEASPTAVAAIEKTLLANECDYLLCKTWTTDAFYRETPGKVIQRRSEGCLTVEMETASFFAVAQFRGVPFGQILYGGDDVSGTAWDSRHWDGRASIRERLFWLAVEACGRIDAS